RHLDRCRRLVRRPGAAERLWRRSSGDLAPALRSLPSRSDRAGPHRLWSLFHSLRALDALADAGPLLPDPFHFVRTFMDSQELTPAEAARTLGRKQRKQMKLLARIEKTAMRLARRRLKLAALESQIADLERHAAGVDRNGSTKQAVLLFNPMSGRKGENDHALRLSQIVDALRAHGIRASIRIKTSGKEARAAASEAAQSGQPLIVVAAGDGTVEEVASQLVGTSTVLGIIP